LLDVIEMLRCGVMSGAHGGLNQTTVVMRKQKANSWGDGLKPQRPEERKGS
jgi:hypothetical protein